ncbi:MAG: DUF3899 domain-containing protein [Lachnospiraceae bacterium]|nr:DUF3899 domain-containing protein [Lachnospiraceae bacterium]
MDTIKKLRKYIIVTIIGILFTMLICWLKDFSFGMAEQRMYKILSDAAFFSAVILIGFGVMISISNFGLFTAVSYSMKRFFTVFSKDREEKRKNMPSYYEYRAIKLENNVSGAFMYIPGLLFLVVSIVFTMLFY